jgi:predicted ArsR family transcriptional regulator
MKDIYKINDLEQIRLLSDPLKLRLLQAFAASAKTTKQVAEELGESVTKLYRHVDALHDSGLLEVVQEKQKRGTIERTFRAVAQRFEADHSLFSDAGNNEGTDVARKMLRVSEAEILNVLSNAHDDDEEQAIVMRIHGRATPEKVAELRATLREWLESVPNNDHLPAEDTREIGGLIAFYQID